MDRRGLLKGLFAFGAVVAACGAKPPGAEAAPLPARPTPPAAPEAQMAPAVATDADVAGAKVDNVYWVVRRRYYYRPRRVYYIRPRRRYYRRVYYRRRIYW